MWALVRYNDTLVSASQDKTVSRRFIYMQFNPLLHRLFLDYDIIFYF